VNRRINILNLALNKKLVSDFIKISYDFSVILDSKFMKKFKKKLDYASSILKEDGEERDLFEEFFDLNSLKFIEWDIIKELDSGIFGTAFIMRDGRVLKLSNSKSEANIKTELMNELHKKEYKDGISQPMIYDVGELDMPEVDSDFAKRFELYLSAPIFSITEKLSIELYDKEENKFELIEKIPESIYQFFKMILKVCEDNKELYNKNSSEDEKLEVIKNYLRNVFNNSKLKVLKEYASSSDEAVLKITNKYDINPGWLDRFIKLCLRNNFEGRGDIHLGNLGVRNGEFVFFDF